MNFYNLEKTSGEFVSTIQAKDDGDARTKGRMRIHSSQWQNYRVVEQSTGRDAGTLNTVSRWRKK